MKADVVRRDERESGLRMILNLGHTVGHALEQATRYKAMLHGEAVAWGMVAALALARRRGTITGAQMERMEKLIYRYGPLPKLKVRAAQHRGGDGQRQEKCGRGAAVRAAGGHWRRGRGGGCDAGGAGGGGEVHAGAGEGAGLRFVRSHLSHKNKDVAKVGEDARDSGWRGCGDPP